MSDVVDQIHVRSPGECRYDLVALGEVMLRFDPGEGRIAQPAPEASRRDAFVVGPEMRGLEIFDRVGGGDSFASGLIYGLLGGGDLEAALAYGVAHGALAMTTPGDTSMATLAEVERVMRGGTARVAR